jgi:hypothetical protein
LHFLSRLETSKVVCFAIAIRIGGIHPNWFGATQIVFSELNSQSSSILCGVYKLSQSLKTEFNSSTAVRQINILLGTAVRQDKYSFPVLLSGRLSIQFWHCYQAG